MQEKQRRAQAQQIADVCGCHTSDLAGRTFGDLLEECERHGIQVWWGFWSPKDLEVVLVPKPTDLPDHIIDRISLGFYS